MWLNPLPPGKKRLRSTDEAPLRIPVAMHNVPEEKIFRPSTAGMFGTKDLESADFRFCQNFGPLYK